MTVSELQGIGEKKYYGKDYMIVNTANVLNSILNDPNANLTYEGAEGDLRAIDAVVPVEVLKEGGLEGYRNYNWAEGRVDINQTLATDSEIKAYFAAYVRVLFYNFSDYMDVQINCFFQSLQLSARHTTYYTSTPINFRVDAWEIGKKELRETFFTSAWENSMLRKWGCWAVSWICNVWGELWTVSGVNEIVHASAIVTDILILFFEGIRLLIERRKEHFRWFVLFLITLGQIISVMLFMPEGRAVYLYPALYVSYLLIFLYCIGCKKNLANST